MNRNVSKIRLVQKPNSYLKKAEIWEEKQMKFRKSMKALGLIFTVFLIIIPLVVQADIYIKQKTHSDGFSMMGQGESVKDVISVTWMGKDKSRIDSGEDMSFIVRFDKHVIYMLIHAEKSYREFALGEDNNILSALSARSGQSGEDTAGAQEMMKNFSGMLKPTGSVTETGESQKIKSWNCKKYDMEMNMMGMTTIGEIWATEDIKIDSDLYWNLSNALVSTMAPMMGMEDWMEEMKKIKGIIVQQESTMTMPLGTEMKTSIELLEASNKPAPAGTYTVPEGYEKQK